MSSMDLEGQGQEGQSSKVNNGGFTLYSWNINGLRTIDMKNVIKNLQNPAIISVQETKISRDQLDESKAFIDDYSSYFSFCRNKPGYSGVGTYCSAEATPCKAEEGISGTTSKFGQSQEKDKIDPDGDFELYDDERSHGRFGDNDGRCIITQHKIQLKTATNANDNVKLLTIFNLYCPRLRNDPDDPINNEEYKMTFHNLIERRAKSLIKNGSFVLIVGDLNICHKLIDQPEIKNEKVFVKGEFRAWLDDLVGVDGDFVDTFRHLHPDREKAYTCWCTRTNARQNNYGTRIDYILADKQLIKYLEKAEIHPEILGSDHCPISATFHTLAIIPSTKLPQFATKNYPEFIGGLQSNLRQFLIKATTTATTTTQSTINNGSTTKRNAQEIKNPKGPPSSSSHQTSLTNFFTKRQKLVEVEDQNELIVSNSNIEVNMSISSIKRSIPVNNEASSKAWKSLLKTPTVPLCTGHSEPCTQRTVRKKGENFGRQFWACSRGSGASSDPNANCNFFKWLRN